MSKAKRFLVRDRALRQIDRAGSPKALARALKISPRTLKRKLDRPITNDFSNELSDVLKLTDLHARLVRVCDKITQAEFSRLSEIPASTISGWIGRGYIPARSFDYARDGLRKTEEKLKRKPIARGGAIAQINFATGLDEKITSDQFDEIARAITRGESPFTRIDTDYGAVADRAYQKYRGGDIAGINLAGDLLYSKYRFSESGHRILANAFLFNLRVMLDKNGRDDLPILPRDEIDDEMIVGSRNAATVGTNDPGQLWGLVEYCDPANGLPVATFVFAYRDSTSVPGAYIVELIEIGVRDGKSKKTKSLSGAASQYNNMIPEFDDDDDEREVGE